MIRLSNSLLLILATVFLTFSSAISFAKSKKLPDFFIFIADDLGIHDTEPYDSPDAYTPNINALAKEGLRFDRAFVNSPSCAPSRAALFTALRSQRNGVEPNHDKERNPGVTHALHELRKLNYEIAAFGKITHGRPKDDSWDHGITHHGGHSIDIKEIEAFLKNRDKKRPLILMVGSRPPHVPWPRKNISFDPEKITLPVASYDNKQARIDFSRYLEDVKTMDKAFGDSRKLVKKYLSPKNTITFFTSDHGAQWPYAKWTLYDTGIRVPFIASWPKKIPKNKSTQAMISWIDIFPTLNDIVGQPQNLKLDGRSFKDVLLNKADTHRDKIFATHTAGGMNKFPIRAVRTDKWKYIRNLYPQYKAITAIDGEKNSSYLATWRADAEKGIEAAQIAVNRYYSRPAEELYDLEKDPYEKNNVVGDPRHANILNQLRADMLRLMIESNDQRPTQGKAVPHVDISDAKPLTLD